MVRSQRLAALALVSSVVLAAPTLAFQKGDFYSGNTYRVLDGCSQNGVINRIDPVTYAITELFVDANGPITLPNLNSSISYDSYRDRIVFYEKVGAEVADFSLLSDTGVVSALPDPTNIRHTEIGGGASPDATTQTAPTGDGRIFLMGRDFVVPTFWRFQYWDANDTLHELLDQTGSSPYTFTPTGALYAIVYDARTNALFFTQGEIDDTTIYKAPLSADGTRVAGPVESTTFAVSASADRPMQWSDGPGSQLFLLIDTNSNLSESRLQLVDPVSLTRQIWATQLAPLVAVQTTGFYDPARAAAIVRFNTDLRQIDQGETGNGTLLASGAFCHSGTSSYLIRIGGPPSVPTLRGGGHAALAAALLGLGLALGARRLR